MQTAAEMLSSHGIKPSVQRIAIMDYLLNHKTHPTVDEIYIALHPSIPTLSRTTVYNTLRLFYENGAALQLSIEDKTAHYDGDTTPHAHFLCEKCGKIFDIFPDELPIVSEIASLRPKGKMTKDIQLYFKGICENCMDIKEKNNND